MWHFDEDALYKDNILKLSRPANVNKDDWIHIVDGFCDIMLDTDSNSITVTGDTEIKIKEFGDVVER